MNGLTVLQTHTAMNLHFSNKTDYDCFKYNFKTNQTEETLKRSKYYWQLRSMESIFSDYEIPYFIFLIFERNQFKYTSLDKVCRSVYPMKKEIHVLNPLYFIQTTFKNDLVYLKQEYDGQLLVFAHKNDSLYSNLYKEYLAENINIKTFILLNIFIINTINTDSSRDTIAWPKFVALCEKLIPFMKLFYKKVDVEKQFMKYFLG